MYTVITTMDDVSDASIEAFGQFKTAAQARAWAVADRAKHVTLTGDEDAKTSFWHDGPRIGFGSFVWQITKLRVVKIKKSKRRK